MDLANQDGASVTDAAKKIKGILAEPPEPTANPEEAAKAEQAPKSESAEELNKSETDAASRRRKAKLGDREIEFEVLTDDVDMDLIPKGLMMEADYRQKTMSLADERKALEGRKSDFEKALADLQDSVMMNAEALDTDEMKELKELDPDQYWKKFDEVKTQADKFKKFREKREEELLEERKKLVENEVSKYAQSIPEWLDEEVKKSDASKMVKFLTKNGFSQEEVGGVYDSRMMAVIRKAALYDEITSTSLESKRVNSIPKSSTPSSKAQKESKTERQKTMERLKKTGKIEDASDAIKNIIFGG